MLMLIIFDPVILWVTLSLVYFIYFFKLVGFYKAWSGIRLEAKPFQGAVSIIVPFRNESKNLGRLVKGLSHQDAENFEVIFVDDHSEDESEEQLLSALKKSEFDYRILHLKDDQGKKAALTLGIEQAQGEVIITTDADCFMDKGWVRAMSSSFAEANTLMVAGPVGLIRKGLFSEMQSIELLSLVGVGGAMIAQGRPTMANGANLAFRKKTFLELEGYKGTLATPSGDDELFMNKVANCSSNSIRFCKDSRALVVTNAAKSWSELVSQKVRWASKWKVGGRSHTKGLALLVGCLQLCQIALMVLLPFYLHWWEWPLALLGSRYLIEYLFAARISKDTGLTRPSIGVFTLSFIIYPFYALYIALLANFGSYSWKGRPYK